MNMNAAANKLRIKITAALAAALDAFDEVAALDTGLDKFSNTQLLAELARRDAQQYTKPAATKPNPAKTDPKQRKPVEDPNNYGRRYKSKPIEFYRTLARLKKEGVKRAAIAAVAHVSPSTVGEWYREERWPTRQHARMVVEVYGDGAAETQDAGSELITPDLLGSDGTVPDPVCGRLSMRKILDDSRKFVAEKQAAAVAP